MKYLLTCVVAVALVACSGSEPAAETETADTEAPGMAAVEMETPAVESEAVEAETFGQRLELILASQPEEVIARYEYRNPYETLQFFGIEPGMNVVEVLPGGGWYTKILLPYLGNEGTLHGVDYNIAMWPEFGGFATEEWIEERKSWPTTWLEGAQEWRDEGTANLNAFTIGTAPAEAAGTVDAVVMIRAYHNFNRFEGAGGYATEALEDMMMLLKPGGILGFVQHRAPEANSDEWANGSNGYVKKSEVIADFEAAGFELVAESEINANAKDQPTEEDVVWRLPPTLGGSKDNEELRAQMIAIGESDRMTLKFRKPVE